MTTRTQPGRALRAVIVALVATAAAVAVLTGDVLYTEADTRATLLVAEQIVDNGTITLDAYPRDELGPYYNFQDKNGHVYDFFPVGTSLLAVPAVALAKWAGIDVVEKDANLQIALAALAAALIVVLLFLLARRFLPFGTSLVLAAITWFGSMLASTGGTALWSHIPAVIFGLLSLLLLVLITEEQRTRLWPLLGLTLFAGYVCRPTMAVLVPFVLGYLLLKSRRQAIGATAVFAGLFVGFVVFSSVAYGSWLPPYYLPGRLGGGSPLEALAGHLVSPSRGLLIYLPAVLVIPALALANRQQVRERRGLLTVAVGWPIALWITASLHSQWYGGFSFGPRILTDALPGLFLALVLVWPRTPVTRVQRAIIGTAAVLALFGVWLHTVQGLHNQYTLIWNVAPRIEDDPGKAWDWEYPQWLATQEREAERTARAEAGR